MGFPGLLIPSGPGAPFSNDGGSGAAGLLNGAPNAVSSVLRRRWIGASVNWMSRVSAKEERNLTPAQFGRRSLRPSEEHHRRHGLLRRQAHGSGKIGVCNGWNRNTTRKQETWLDGAHAGSVPARR